MELCPSPILGLLFLFMVASDAALPSEIYWNSLLPNTSMPQAIKKTLRSGEASLSIHNGPLTRIAPDDREKYGKWYRKGTKHSHIAPDDREKYGWYGKGTKHSHIAPDDRQKYGKWYGEDGINEIASHLYLLEKDIIPGTQKYVYFKKGPSTTTFLPREVADSIPFSSNKLPEILEIFSMKPDSIEAGIISKAIKDCEEPANKGEERECATSLESMVDFSILELGREVKAFSTEVERKEDKMQLYTFTSGVKKIGSSKSVVCHDLNYAYAVFYCHEVPKTAAYIVPLVGADGSSANAVAVCHEDTSTWNPNHLAFQVLKVKPGDVPVCHFLVEETVLWVGS